MDKILLIVTTIEIIMKTYFIIKHLFFKKK